MTGLRIVDDRGMAVALGKELGRGGEGIVSDIQGRPDSVAKIYLKSPSQDLAAKLTAMSSMADSRLTSLAAWPTSTLRGAGGAVVGFVMPKVDGHRPVFQLYGPKLRLREFPTADWRFLIHAGANTARAFAAIHAAGLVIGDVNHGNLVVGGDARVRLIDCDSFQVTHGGRTWLCEVGVGTHQPPEMQGVTSYKSVVRTPNHDAFGLAVLIFQLLCMARHPFAGRSLRGGDPPTIEQAITESRYAFSTDQRRTGMAPPPGSLPMDALTPGIRHLFAAAFAPSSAKGGRPDGERWVAALQELSASLRQCKANQHHYHLSHLAACPWCQIETETGAPLFPAVFVTPKSGASGMVALWQQVRATPAPPSMPSFPDPLSTACQPAPEVVAWRRSRKRERTLAAATLTVILMLALTVVPFPDRGPMILSGIIFTLVVFFRPRGGVASSVQDELRSARTSWAQLRSAWEASPPRPTFGEVRASLDRIKVKFDELGVLRTKRMKSLWERRKQSQLAEHLNRHYIARVKIPGIGSAKITTLQSHGVDTAYDVDRAKILLIPGFGTVITNRLVDWRASVERSFVFDAQKGVSSADLDALEREVAAIGAGLERDMAAGLAQLRAILQSEALRRRLLSGKASEIGSRLAQAEANARALGLNG